MAEPNNKAVMELSKAEFQELLAKANQGDNGALDKLDEFLDQHPDICHELGDVAHIAKTQMVNTIANDNGLLRKSVLRQLRKFRQGLEEPDDCGLTRLAIGRIELLWLEVHHLIAIQPVAQSRLLLKQRESSERRLNAALKNLASLRKTLASARQHSRLTPKLRVVGVS